MTGGPTPGAAPARVDRSDAGGDGHGTTGRGPRVAGGGPAGAGRTRKAGSSWP